MELRIHQVRERDREGLRVRSKELHVRRMGMGMVVEVEEEGMVVVVEEEEEERLGMEEGLRQEEMKLGRGEVEASERYHTHKISKLHNTQRRETLHKCHTLFC